MHSCSVIYNSRIEYQFILNFTHSTVSAQSVEWNRETEKDVCASVGKTVVGQASPDIWISFLSVVDIYKLNANVIISIDHLFSPVPGAWVCFVFSQHFKVKPEKIKSWNHYWERSEHKYFIIWYFLCKIEFMHGDVKAVRIQKYQAIVSLS